MTAPLTPQREMEIRAYAADQGSGGDWRIYAMLRDLLAEVERLRNLISDYREHRRWI